MGAGSTGNSVTIALRGTVPVTSEVVAVGGGEAEDACGVLDPHPAVRNAASVAINVIVRMNLGW